VAVAVGATVAVAVAVGATVAVAVGVAAAPNVCPVLTEPFVFAVVTVQAKLP
jgi:hypothetical protein